MDRNTVLVAFKSAWVEYLRIFASQRNNWVDWVKGRTTKDNDTHYNQIRRTGDDFLDGFRRDQGSESHDACQCVKALNVFTPFLVRSNQKYKGWDACFKDIFNVHHLDFKKKWVVALETMVAYIRVVYPAQRSDPASVSKWQIFLQATGTNWSLIENNIRDAKRQIEREENGVAIKKTERARNIDALPSLFRRSKSQLTEPHTLQRMRGLLCEI